MSMPEKTRFTSTTTLGWTLLVAAAYFAAGKLGLLLAIPPGYATIFSPASGVALAAVLFLGNRASVGVFLGSFLVNVSIITHDATSSLTLVRLLTIAAGMGLGAPLQAVVAAVALRRIVGFPNGLATAGKLVKAVVVAGPAGCVISASVAVGGLHACGLLQANQLPGNWLTWWVGDSLGALLAFPFLQSAMGEPGPGRMRRVLQVSLPVLVCTVATIGMHVKLRNLEEQRLHENFVWHATELEHGVTARVSQVLQGTRELQVAMALAREITREDFESLAREFSYSNPETLAYCWAPRADASRDDLFVSYAWPEAGNRWIPLCESALARLPREDAHWSCTKASPAVQSTQGDQNVNLVLVFAPVYEGKLKPATAAQPPARLRGFVVSVLSVRRLLNMALHGSDSSGLAIRFYEAGNGGDDSVVAFGSSMPLNEVAPLKYPIEIGGRKWILEAAMASEFVAAHQSWCAWLFLGAGLIFTFMLGLILMIASERTRTIERLVAIRTSELHEKHAHLEQTLMDLEEAHISLEFQAHELVCQANRLQEAQWKAEQASRAKSEFLANMSHEIRTPMTAILGFTDVLLGFELPSEHHDVLLTIRRNGEHLLQLINDILDISKIEAGKLEVERIACRPAQLLADLEALMAPRARLKNIGLEIRLDGAIPTEIVSDPTRLKQVLVNLVGNAIKFTETGGVQITARTLHQQGPTPQLQIAVRDTGIGITPEQLSKLFQPFTQADASTTRRFGGTGLGLAISKQLVEMLGGSINVRSVAGQGSTFTVTIPTGDLSGAEWTTSLEPRQTPSATAAQAQVHLRGRILLVEDGPDNQRLISFVLRKAGAEVTLADNGQAAVELALAAAAENQPYDVILMDMQMPVLDGYGATRKLREAGYTGPIIALTAHAMSGDREKCLAAGCDDYATKPIDRVRLLQAVQGQLAANASSLAVAPS